MMCRAIAVAGVLGVVPIGASATISDVVCDDAARMERQLASAPGAVRISRGMRGPDAILEVWTTPGNGEWTLVQTYANGTSCIVAMGQHWETIVPPKDPA